MSNPDNNTSAPSAAKPKRAPGAVTRVIVISLVILITLAALVIGIPWGHYRFQHVVLSEAIVKGTVTRLGTRIEGRVKNIEVEVGQRVSKGDVLLRMEDRHLQAALDRARAELQSAMKDLDSEKMGIEQARRRLTLELERVNGGRKKASGELEAANSNLSKLEKQYDRFTTVLKTGGISANEMDRVTGDRDRAQGMVNAANGVLEAAESNYQKAMNELEGVHVREARLGVTESQIAVARARVAAAEADLDATVLKAPEDGRVLERSVEVGGSAKVGEPMISMWIGRAWVEAWVDERDLSKITIGGPVDVSLDASPNRKLAGRVESIGLATDKHLQPTPVPSTLHTFVHQSAMVPVRVALDEDNSRIQLGLSVLVGIKKETAPSESGLTGMVTPASATNGPNRLTKANAVE